MLGNSVGASKSNVFDGKRTLKWPKVYVRVCTSSAVVNDAKRVGPPI
jgi:hypothetical protein